MSKLKKYYQMQKYLDMRWDQLERLQLWKIRFCWDHTIHMLGYGLSETTSLVALSYLSSSD